MSLRRFRETVAPLFGAVIIFRESHLRSGVPMANKPVLFAIDDDPEVLRAVERDLRRKYARGRNGEGYRVLRADSAATALDTLGKLKLRGDPVALFLVDQRMPRTTGV